MNTKISDASMFSGMSDAHIAHAVRWAERHYKSIGRDPLHCDVALCVLRDCDAPEPTAKPEAVRLRDELRERAAFEAWARWYAASVEQDEQGDYASISTNMLWNAWQAALDSVQPSPAGQGDALPPLPVKDVIDTHISSGVRIYGYTAEQMHDYARAALAATGKQQVGEVRGDALSVRTAYAIATSWREQASKLKVGRATLIRCAAELEAALAARQPVGENPAWRDELVREAYNRGLADGLNADRQPAEGPLLTLDSGVQLPLVRNGDNYRLDPAIGQPARAVEQPNDPGRTLYIDLDGVMADFDGAFPAVFGLDHRSLADDEMWGHINSHPSFFRDLPPMAGALDFFRSVEHLNPVILTACPKSNYKHVATQKRAWVRAHLSQTCLVLPVLGGRHKPLFMHQAGDVLIDDFGKNCAAWTDAGGIAIKHEGDWTATRAALALIDSGKAVQS